MFLVKEVKNIDIVKSLKLSFQLLSYFSYLKFFCRYECESDEKCTEKLQVRISSKPCRCASFSADGEGWETATAITLKLWSSYIFIKTLLFDHLIIKFDIELVEQRH